MKQKFKEIIKSADESLFAQQRDTVCLAESELETAAENCASLTIEMMEKFGNWMLENSFTGTMKGKFYNYQTKQLLTTRELIDRFLSEQQ